MSATSNRIELVLRRLDGELELLVPDVGQITSLLPRGAALAPGMVAGALHRLGRSVDLVVPAGAGGIITSDRPDTVMSAVGYHECAYRLDPAGVPAAEAAAGADATGGLDGALAVVAGQPGRVWLRPSPGDPVFCGPGDTLEDGSAVCLIEVMKTFSTVPYRATGPLPARAKVVRWLVEDGADVDVGQALVEVEAC